MTEGSRSIGKIDDSPVPEDVSLPGLSRLLNRNAFKDLMDDHLDSALGPIASCRIVYIRYKPGTNCIVAYSLECPAENLRGCSGFLVYAKVLTEADYRTALDKTLHHRWIETTGIRPVIPLPREKAILYTFPNDPVIEGLRLLSNPKKLQRVLYKHYEEYPESEWRISDKKIRMTPVRFKPERRVVLRCDTRAAHRESAKRIPLSVYLRFYGDDTGRSVSSVQKYLYDIFQESGRFRIARPIAYLEDRRLLMMETLQGDPLYDTLVSSQAQKNVSETSAALAALHESSAKGLQKRDLESYLADARSTCSMLKSLLPENQGLTDQVMSRLENHRHKGRPSATGFVHGDFYYGQVLAHEKGTGILDFDRSHSGESISDLGNFCAHLRLLRIRGHLDTESVLAECFVAKYEQASGNTIDKRQFRFWTAYNLFLLAVGPFRHLESGWRRRTREILEECNRILS